MSFTLPCNRQSISIFHSGTREKLELHWSNEWVMNDGAPSWSSPQNDSCTKNKWDALRMKSSSVLRKLARSIFACDKNQTPALVNGCDRFWVTMEKKTKKTGGRCEMLTASGGACSWKLRFQMDLKMSGDAFGKDGVLSVKLKRGASVSIYFPLGKSRK